MDFDGDVPGQAPATGKWNQPTSLSIVGGTTILVQLDENGLNTQPVEIVAIASNEFASVNMTVGRVISDVVRVEATIALDRLVDAVLLFTSGQNRTISDLHATSALLLTDHFGAPVGEYIPNQPFRVRMDVDMTAGEYSVTIDNQLDGFGDNPTFSHLPFGNPPSSIPWLDNVGARLIVSNNFANGASVAYDDIDVTCPGIEITIDIRPVPGQAKLDRKGGIDKVEFLAHRRD